MIRYTYIEVCLTSCKLRQKLEQIPVHFNVWLQTTENKTKPVTNGHEKPENYVWLKTTDQQMQKITAIKKLRQFVNLCSVCFALH